VAIERVKITDFLVFTGEFEAEFCNGVNVIIGGNGCGKTTLMKAMYMACNAVKSRYMEYNESNKSNVQEPNKEEYKSILIGSYFQNYFQFKSMTVNFQANRGGIRITIPNNGSETYAIHVSVKDYIKESIFIPTDDMLSHSKGFLPLYFERAIPYDKTFADILAKAELPITHDITPNAALFLDEIKKIIGGEVIHDNGIFFIEKESNERIPFSLEASGFKKLGLLWKLLRNGLLEAGSVLFWDEPENSLNPESIPFVVDTLLTLSHNGVQIFLATHDYRLARHFDVRKNNDVPVLFHNLVKNGRQNIICNTSSTYSNITDNKLEEANEVLFEAVVSHAMGDDGDE
jgi:AAA15 family ATPase/GTPase